MKLGVAYNVFDGEELLEASILSVKQCVDYICVVYQTTSNFGLPCDSKLEGFLNALQSKGLVDELVKYEPRTFPRDEKRALTSPYASLGAVGESVSDIGDQFLNELTKREIGRQRCEGAGCTYFMSMDCDEFYLRDELRKVKSFMEDNPIYDGCACLMRYFYKSPRFELLPLDIRNHVPLMYKIRKGTRFLLAHPYPCLVDPTRALSGVQRFKIFERSFVQMYHYSFVRRPAGIVSKLRNVSNRANYTMEETDFLKKFKQWHPDAKKRPPHPHPAFAQQFTKSQVVDNWFNIPEVFEK
eukprot:TRINITY_DN1472_c0_g1_i1.p1 TRINITY_DN1472_c0_g1~~TRINITY_DN1472_c0_g1_i1.p1  ORF type:complete len:309 (-),score=94.35 TRINITY_DN1472_c0_g1_i1:215-1108(-)